MTEDDISEAKRMDESSDPFGDDPDELLALFRESAGDRYKTNGLRKVGEKCVCPTCGNVFVKKSYQQRFCPPIVSKRKKKKRYICKDKYHNTMTDDRMQRAMDYSGETDRREKEEWPLEWDF